ncbi:glycosyltransferase family 61 protein [Marivita sp.]|uniref:glycosyltransferase family 61 protein n=1 Tax=Marivita sp. TaxID=2003365 RepID=UPI0025C1C394|nr:glycosyltransferase family 61 protein [Marivita sp.]
MTPRSFAALYAPKLLMTAQNWGVMPHPETGSAIRRLKDTPGAYGYTRTIHGAYDPQEPMRAPDLRPDTPEGDAYAARIAEHGTYPEPWNFGVFDVPAVRLLAQHGVHSAKSGNFIEVYCGPEALRNPKYELARLTLPALPLKGEHAGGILLAPAWHHNFYHWMIDILPRLTLLSQPLSEGLPIVVPDSLKGFARGTLAAALAALEIENEIVILSDGAHRFDRLVMPTNLSRTLDVSPSQRDFLRSVFSPKGTDGQKKRRIYISREDAQVRRIANEAEIREILLPLDFEIVTMSGLSVPEQAALFASADIVITHHGAAMTHLAFCDPGTVAIEIFQDGHFAPCFAKLAQLGDLRYGFGVGTPVQGDTHLDSGQLVGLLDRIGL